MEEKTIEESVFDSWKMNKWKSKNDDKYKKSQLELSQDLIKQELLLEDDIAGLNINERLQETQDCYKPVVLKLKKIDKKINQNDRNSKSSIVRNQTQHSTRDLVTPPPVDTPEYKSRLSVKRKSGGESEGSPSKRSTTASETTTDTSKLNIQDLNLAASIPLSQKKPVQRCLLPDLVRETLQDLNETFDEGSSSQKLRGTDADDSQMRINNEGVDKDNKPTLTSEGQPEDIPFPEDTTHTSLHIGMSVYAMKNAPGPWFKACILEILPKDTTSTNFTTYRVKFHHQTEDSEILLQAKCIAYAHPRNTPMAVGTRVIALGQGSNNRDYYYPGVVAETPCSTNKYRYLIFFDDGYSQYVDHQSTRVICESSALVWDDVLPLSREFIKEYLRLYPQRVMVQLRQGQEVKTEWDGEWSTTTVANVDASLALLVFNDGRKEWIYRGSPRLEPLYLELIAAEIPRPRSMSRWKQPRSTIMPYVEYTCCDNPSLKLKDTHPTSDDMTQQERNESTPRKSTVVKPSTSESPRSSTSQSSTHGSPGTPSNTVDTAKNKLVYYAPKNAVRPYKLLPHNCSAKCKRSDVLSLKELRTYNPLAKPLLSGWERQLVRFNGQKEVMYRAPCGRRLRNMKELHKYLRLTDSELPVDLFDFYHGTRSFAALEACNVLAKRKDLSSGIENVRVPCVNNYDGSLPDSFSYNPVRTSTAEVPINLDPEFLCGCDCTDDCEDKSKCACWKMTLEGARTIGLEGTNVGYKFKRLSEPLLSGIYECNSRCKCKQTCLNRVVQHPLQLKLQVFKTLNRGWGIRTLNDIPKGSFLCVYAGKLLTDAAANVDGLSDRDEYFAALDYIEVAGLMKEGYEQDIADSQGILDQEESVSSAEELSPSSEDEGLFSPEEDFISYSIPQRVAEFGKLHIDVGKEMEIENPRRELEEKDREEKRIVTDSDNISFINIMEETAREPSSFTPKDSFSGNEYKSKYRSVRTFFNEEEAYILDAKDEGNIGRYFNHSCSPNVFVQNVFVDTHDPRFPWVAFFALSHVRAGTELTWNYNYDVGSVPGKVLYCYCEAPNCRGRLL